MKKITFILSFITCTAFGQVTIVDRTGGSYSAGNTQYSRPSAESDRFGDTEYILCADSFSLSQPTQLLTAEFYGENVSNSFSPTNFSVFIVQNSGAGLPQLNSGVTVNTTIQNLFGGPVSLVRIPISQGFSITQFNTGTRRTDIAVDFTIANGNSNVILPAGDYWIIAAQYVPDGSPGEGTFYWGWLGSSFSTPTVPQVFNNSFFSSGWDDISYFGSNVTPNSLAWKMTGNIVLSSDQFSQDSILLFPNPANDIVTINLPGNVIVSNLKLYTTSGQEIDLVLNPQDSQIDISSLSSGVYLLTGQTNLGAFNKKIVKI